MALVGAFSVNVKTDGLFAALIFFLLLHVVEWMLRQAEGIVKQ